MDADCTEVWQHPDLGVAAEIVVVDGGSDSRSCRSADGSDALAERVIPKTPEPEGR